MNINLPPKLRLALYIFGGVGSIFVIYFQNKHYIGDPEVNLWAALQVFINGLAAINVTATATKG